MGLRRALDQNFEMHSGDTKDIVVTVLDELDQKVDITGSTAVFILSKNEFSAAIVTKTTGGGIALTDPVHGELTVTLDTADTEPLIGEHYFEIELTDASLRVSTVVVGHIDIRPNVIE
jgi:hypothetical protein